MGLSFSVRESGKTLTVTTSAVNALWHTMWYLYCLTSAHEALLLCLWRPAPSIFPLQQFLTGHILLPGIFKVNVKARTRTDTHLHRHTCAHVVSSWQGSCKWILRSSRRWELIGSGEREKKNRGRLKDEGVVVRCWGQKPLSTHTHTLTHSNKHNTYSQFIGASNVIPLQQTMTIWLLQVVIHWWLPGQWVLEVSYKMCQGTHTNTHTHQTKDALSHSVFFFHPCCLILIFFSAPPIWQQRNVWWQRSAAHHFQAFIFTLNPKSFSFVVTVILSRH